MIKRIASMVMVVWMVLSLLPLGVFAEGEAGCTHVHDPGCGYQEAEAEVLCDKDCTDTDGDGALNHVEGCAYTPADPGAECKHQHDETCGGLPVPQQKADTCTCASKCVEGAIDESCPICSVEGAAVSDCAFQSVEPEEDTPVCTCTARCAEGAINGECRVCGAEGADLTVCTGKIQETEKKPALSESLQALQDRIRALPTGEEYRAMTADQQAAIYEEAAAISEEYVALSEEDQVKLDITRLEELFAVINEGIGLYNGEVTFLNFGYPYGRGMGSRQITLVVEVNESGASYQWQESDSKDGTFDNITGATESTYTFTPTSGRWYRCMVNGAASEAVMAVYPNQTWTKPYDSWYISNGTMAYMADEAIFDVTGLYTKSGTNYMLCTSYGKKWDLYSSTSATPSAGTTTAASTAASLDALRVAFDSSNAYNIFFEADLEEGQQAFSFGCDTQLGNSSTSGGYDDKAALHAMVQNGVLQQIAMIGAASLNGATDDNPAFVIAPVTPPSKFWIGQYDNRKTYAYNTSGGTSTETIDGQNVVTLVENTDSGMTMSWMNISSGGSVTFRFSVGSVANTGAVSGKVNYEDEKLTELEANTTYTITYGEYSFTITADAAGTIPLSGRDQNEVPYDFVGQTITIAKQNSSDTPAEITVAARPDTPEKPSSLEEYGSAAQTPVVDDSIEIVELTPTSVTISPIEGQQYAYSTGGTNWTTLTSINGDGNYVISVSTEGSTVKIRTRIPATRSAPASQWSNATEVTLKPTVVVTATGWNDVYDGSTHSIAVSVNAPAEGATITYSSNADAEYSEVNPTFMTAGEYTVYYRVTANGYYPACGSATVTIQRRKITVSGIQAKDKTYDGSTNAEVVYTLDNKVEGDDLNITGTAAFNDANVGENRTVTISNLTLAGASQNNYTLTTSGSLTTTASIKKKPVSAELTVSPKTYDGTRNAEVTAAIPEGNLVTGDSVTITGIHGSFDSAAAGENKPVTVDASQKAISGSGVEHYEISIPNTTEGRIAKKSLTVTARDKTITYGDAPVDNGVEYRGFVDGETKDNLTGKLGYTFDYIQFGDVGTDYTITPGGLTSENYEITFNTGKLTVVPKSLAGTGVFAALEKTAYAPTGNAIVPSVTVTDGNTVLEPGVDFTVAYSGNAPTATPATAVATISGKGNYKDTLIRKFVISEAVAWIPALPATGNPDDLAVIGAYERAREAFDLLDEEQKALLGAGITAEYEEKLGVLFEALTDYKITKGNESRWYQGSPWSLSFTANGAYHKFTQVRIDGNVLSAAHYTAKSGSTIITLSASYLQTLSIGKHTIQVDYADGTTDVAYFIINPPSIIPMTGDTSHILLIGVILLLSAAGLSGMLAFKKRVFYQPKYRKK